MTSTARAILEYLAQQGVSVTARCGNLLCSPKERLTGPLKREIRQHKAEIISLLERKAPYAPEMWDLFEGMVEFYAAEGQTLKAIFDGIDGISRGLPDPRELEMEV